MLHFILLYFIYLIYTPIYICNLLYTTLIYFILYQLFIRLCIFSTLLYFIVYYFLLSNSCYSAYLLNYILSLLFCCIMLHLFYILRFILSCYALYCIARYIILLYALLYDCYCRTCLHVGEEWSKAFPLCLLFSTSIFPYTSYFYNSFLQ